MKFLAPLLLFFVQVPPELVCPTGYTLNTECAADADADRAEEIAAAKRRHSNRVAAARAACATERADCYDGYDACMALAGSNTSAQITCLGNLTDCTDDADDTYNGAVSASAATRDQEIATAESSYLIALGLCCEDD